MTSFLRSCVLSLLVANTVAQPIDVMLLPGFRTSTAPPNDTAIIQQAIDLAATGHGGGSVLLRAGQTFVSWPLQLRSNVSIVIDGVLSTNGDPQTKWTPDIPHGAKVALLWGFGITNVTVTSSKRGLGEIYGNGSAWWPLRRKDYSFWAPMMFSCQHCSHVRLSNFRVRDSPAWCLENTGDDIVIDSVQIAAPRDSPNTDGIGINCLGRADKPCVVRNCHIDNGDDEVAIGGSNVLVENSYFASGHGASIGSLGFNGSTAHVNNVTFRGLTFNGTTSTMRIKTWQGGHGLVANVTYENITMHRVGLPILITQYYCPGSQHPGACPNLTGVVRIENVTIKNVTGTHTGDLAGQFLCSDTPRSCEGLRLENVHLSAASTADPDGKSDVILEASGAAVPPSSNRFECWKAVGSSMNVTPAPCLDSD